MHATNNQLAAHPPSLFVFKYESHTRLRCTQPNPNDNIYSSLTSVSCDIPELSARFLIQVGPSATRDAHLLVGKRVVPADEESLGELYVLLLLVHNEELLANLHRQAGRTP